MMRWRWSWMAFQGGARQASGLMFHQAYQMRLGAENPLGCFFLTLRSVLWAGGQASFPRAWRHQERQPLEGPTLPEPKLWAK